MTHWARTNPKARKEHRCDMCSRTIEPGETYSRGAGMDGTFAWSWIECAHCEQFARFAARNCDPDEEFGLSSLDDFEPETPDEFIILEQYSHQWRRYGLLYPIPLVTDTVDRFGFGWPSTIVPGPVTETKENANA